jgi:hypothetical protein
MRADYGDHSNRKGGRSSQRGVTLFADGAGGWRAMNEEAEQVAENALRILTGGCVEHRSLTFYEFVQAGGSACPICLHERNRMLSDIVLSAVALKLNIEHGCPPKLDALNRDLNAFQARFGSHPTPDPADQPSTR